MTPEQYRKKYEANDMTEREELIYLKEENKKLERQLKILQKYQVQKDIDGTYFLSKGIYSMATFGKDFKKEAREFKKALGNG